MKRYLSLFLSIIMCFSLVSLAGCGGEDEQLGTYTEEEVIGEVVKGENKENKDDDNTSSGSTTTNKADATEQAYFENVPSELNGTTVKFATWIDHKSCDYSYVFSDFTKLTGIKVEIVPVTQVDYIVKLTGMKASGTAPDVIVENGDFPRTLSLLQPITKEATGIDLNDKFWDANVTKLYTVGGKVYAINGANSSWQMASPLVYYNIPLLQKHGIKNPSEYVKENNWTWETLLKCMEDGKKAGITGGEIDVTVFSNVYGGGPYHYDAKTGQYSNTMGTQKFKDTWNYLSSAQEKGIVKLTNTWASSLTSGYTGLVISGAYGLRKQPGWFYQMDSDDIGYAYLPKVNKSDANYPTSTMTRAYGIADGAKNPKGAAYFLRYFLNDDWYDTNDIFKDERAANMHYELQKIKDFSNPQVDGVVLTQYDDFKVFFNELTTSTPAQITANIDKVSQKLDYCVKKANKMIEEAK